MGWTDGLPVVPPVAGPRRPLPRHDARDPEEWIWRMPQLHRSCTVRLAAANAAMAGCRPEYFPVVLAALEATIDEGWPGTGGWQSTTGGGPIHIVNGPVRSELGFNSTGNVFGPGFRANVTVGRAIRLIIMNVYGIKPHELDQSTQGTPGKIDLLLSPRTRRRAPGSPSTSTSATRPSRAPCGRCTCAARSSSTTATRPRPSTSSTTSPTRSLVPARPCGAREDGSG